MSPFIVSAQVQLRPSPAASQWVKNKLREHGPTFTVMQAPRAVLCHQGAVAVFVRADAAALRAGWIGWLPVAMIVAE